MQTASLLPQKFEGLVTADAGTGTLSLDIASVLSPSALVLRIAAADVKAEPSRPR